MHEKNIDDQSKLLEEEDISDRTPILDILIEKWKYFNKYKKTMLDRYSKNAFLIRDSFDKITKYLGIEDFDELPIILEKMEDQMSSIEIFISKLTNEINILEENKRLLEQKIDYLKGKSTKIGEEKTNFKESKIKNINVLKNHISELKDDIEKKRNFFLKLQKPTDEFLAKSEDTYISEYIPEKFAVNREVEYNETNIVDIIATVQDYVKLLDEFDKYVNNNAPNSAQPYDKKADILVNKDIEKLKQEMRVKLESFRKDNYINNNFYSSMKNESKINNSFDETIKKMAEEIIKVVNTQGLQNKDNTIKKKK
jgi:hypothetical protein